MSITNTEKLISILQGDAFQLLTVDWKAIPDEIKNSTVDEKEQLAIDLGKALVAIVEHASIDSVLLGKALKVLSLLLSLLKV